MELEEIMVIFRSFKAIIDFESQIVIHQEFRTKLILNKYLRHLRIPQRIFTSPSWKRFHFYILIMDEKVLVLCEK